MSKFMSLNEAALQLGIPIEELNRLRQAGEIRGFADRGTFRFNPADVEALSRRIQEALWSPADDSVSVTRRDMPCQKLIELLARYGLGICDDPKRLEWMLKDVLRNEHRREVFALSSALREGIVQRLRDGVQGFPPDVLKAKLVRQLCDNLGFKSSIAKWTVETWAISLRSDGNTVSIAEESSAIQIQLCPDEPGRIPELGLQSQIQQGGETSDDLFATRLSETDIDELPIDLGPALQRQGEEETLADLIAHLNETDTDELNIDVVPELQQQSGRETSDDLFATRLIDTDSNELTMDVGLPTRRSTKSGARKTTNRGAVHGQRSRVSNSSRLRTPAVGIDLGTEFSCISYLNEHGEPVTLPNQEGELTTPSVVMFDGKDVIVGTEALRKSVINPTQVIQNAKRFIGSKQTWTIGKRTYTPSDIGALVLRKMLNAAAKQIGSITQAAITVPAWFSDCQRQATIDAGLQAGLMRVDLVSEPVAAALCYVLGSEGLWFTELCDEQRILVFDVGAGSFDLSLVKYHKDEVKLLASTGDLKLGGIEWNEALANSICDRFAREFGDDPRCDPESMQLLAMAVENTIRSLNVRPRAALSCSHGKHRKVYQIELPEFEKLTKPLVQRAISITRDLQKAYQFGFKQTDTVLTVGCASRMPAIKKALNELGFRTLNISLSPDQSISHGATYYAGMLLTNADFAKSILGSKSSATST